MSKKIEHLRNYPVTVEPVKTKMTYKQLKEKVDSLRLIIDDQKKEIQRLKDEYKTLKEVGRIFIDELEKQPFFQKIVGEIKLRNFVVENLRKFAKMIQESKGGD